MFLDLENIDLISSSRKGMLVQDREALGKLNSSVRLVDGHYEVGMLWKHENPWLPNNRMTAVARLRSLRRRLCADEQLCYKYRNFMDDLLTKGYARKLTKTRLQLKVPGRGICHTTVSSTVSSTHANQEKFVWYLMLRHYMMEFPLTVS